MNAVQAIQSPAIQNVMAEGAVIGALLCQPELIDRIADDLNEADFAEPFFGHLYALIVREHSLGKPANPITLRPLLEGNPAFEELGGMSWLFGLTAEKLNILATPTAAAQIAELARRRRLIDGLTNALAAAHDCQQPLGDVITVADDAIAGTRERDDRATEVSGVQTLDRIINSFDEPVSGVFSKTIQSLDEAIGPMRPTHLIIGAGRPGMGKTAVAVSYSLGVAAQGQGVLMYSLEMSADDLGERMAADLCFDGSRGIPYEKIRDRQLDMLQQREICRARDRIADMPIQIIDRSSLSIAQLHSSARRWKRRFEARGIPLGLIVLDYLQLMAGSRRSANDNRTQEISEISRGLKEIAKELQVPVFALSQLSRAVEQRADKTPQLSDLRESGQIEQDADIVLFLLRDEYYLMQTEPHYSDARYDEWRTRLDKCAGRIDFICAKRRGGRTGKRIGNFYTQYQAVRG